MAFAGGGVEGGGADRSGVTGGRRFDEAALALGAEPVAVAADGQHLTVMEQPVEDRGRDDRIGEHRARLGHAPVRRNKHCARLVTADELEEQVRNRKTDIRVIIEPANVDDVLSPEIHAGWCGRCRRAKIGSEVPKRL